MTIPTLYGPLIEIRKTLRFATYKGALNDRPVFVKITASDETKDKLLLEAVGLINMKELDRAEQYYCVPTVIEIEGSHIVTSWVDGSPMSEDFYKGNPQLNERLAYLIELYAFIDSRTSGSSGVTRYNQPGRESGVDSILRKLESINFGKHIDARLIHDIAKYARQSVQGAETRFTNGDLQPGNILIDSNGTITVIDCESCSWLWPRHYNVVNFVFNYGSSHAWLRPKLLEFFNDYCKKIQVDSTNVANAFNLSAAMRCMQVVYEALGPHLEKKPEDVSLPPELKAYVEGSIANIISGRLFFDSL